MNKLERWGGNEVPQENTCPFILVQKPLSESFSRISSSGVNARRKSRCECGFQDESPYVASFRGLHPLITVSFAKVNAISRDLIDAYRCEMWWGRGTREALQPPA